MKMKMQGQIEEMFNKVKDDEISLPEFVEWVGKIIDKSGEEQHSIGFDDGYAEGCFVCEYNKSL